MTLGVIFFLLFGFLLFFFLGSNPNPTSLWIFKFGKKIINEWINVDYNICTWCFFWLLATYFGQTFLDLLQVYSNREGERRCKKCWWKAAPAQVFVTNCVRVVCVCVCVCVCNCCQLECRHCKRLQHLKLLAKEGISQFYHSYRKRVCLLTPQISLEDQKVLKSRNYWTLKTSKSRECWFNDVHSDCAAKTRFYC